MRRVVAVCCDHQRAAFSSVCSASERSCDSSDAPLSPLSPCSFGMVLTKGHGKLMFTGNVSVEEGGIFPTILCCIHKKGCGQIINMFWTCECINGVLFQKSGCSPAGLHDLTSPDLNIASEWYVCVRTGRISCVFPACLGAGVASVSLGSVSFRTYCETDIDPSHRKYSQLQAAIRYLLGKEPDLECKADPAGRRPPPGRSILL